MMKRANISWNARQLSKMIEKGSITFDSAVQRGLVWDNDRKSLLIHSMMTGFPIPAMYAAKDTETKILSMLDGKQRSNAINDFLHGRFTLSNVPEVVLEDGTEVDVNGMYFSGLCEELQDIISNYSLTIYYFEDISDEDVAELFYRINNGKALSSVEMSRVRSKALKTIQEIGQHELFTTALTEKAFEKYTHEDLVIKSYIMLTSDTPCLDTKVVRPTMEKAEFSEQDINIMNGVFNRILNTYKTIVADDSPETGKLSKRIAKRLLTRTHMLSIMPIVKKSLIDRVPDDVFTLWVKNFFCGSRSATKYDEYNSRCTAGSGHAETIKIRLDVIKKDYNKFMKKIEKERENDRSVNEVNEIVETVETVENTETVEETSNETVEVVKATETNEVEESVDVTENEIETVNETETVETDTDSEIDTDNDMSSLVDELLQDTDSDMVA